jgi:hypothetical protein
MPDGIDPRYEQELMEYFAARDAIQPPSNFARMTAVLQALSCEKVADADWSNFVHPTGSKGLAAAIASTELNERLLKLLDDEYPARRVLSAIGARRAVVLELACTLPSLGWEAFGRRCQLAMLTVTARRAWVASKTTRELDDFLERLSSRVRKGRGDRLADERILAKTIAGEAAALWWDALGSYGVARDRYSELCRSRSRATEACRAERLGI